MPSSLQQHLGAVLSRFAALSPGQAAQDDLAERTVGGQLGLLGEIGHGDARLHEGLAAVQLDQTSQDPQQRGFPRAVAADQADPVAARKHGVEAGEQLLLADAQAGVLQGEDRWSHGRTGCG